MLLDSAGVLRIAAARGLPPEVVQDTAVREGEGIAGWVLATEQPLVVEDLEDKGPRSRRHGVRSAMAVPIRDDDGLIGVLNVGSAVFHPRFSSTQLTSLQSLGRVVALALRNADAISSSRELFLETVKALALALETKDPYSYGSTERVFELASRLGEAAGLSQPEQQALRVAALLHDIGMAAAGDVMAAGDRPLTTDEQSMLKLHPAVAADVLAQAPALRDAVPIVYHHHEHFDGGGYVEGLAGEDIPLGARVLAVADAYVSLTSPRPYREALTHEAAIAELAMHAGTQFDPGIVEALQHVLVEERLARAPRP
jgi:HD-GYP domain-containing protein (c-di-GMP phosphodiesterase class II)